MKELFEIGMIPALFNFANIWLTVIMWICILAGGLIQYIILKKCTSWAKWIFTTVLVVTAFVCEALTYIITGWDLLGVLIIYGFVFVMLLGVVITTGIYHIKNKAK